MSIDVSTLPNKQFFAASGLFPNIIANEIEAEQRAVDILNAKGLSDFNYEVAKWMSAATLVRNADQHATLPTKPISPPSWTVLTQDSLPGETVGKWIAQSQTGAPYGVCPDLPPLHNDPPKITNGPPQAFTQDQKLDSIAATVLNIQQMLKTALGVK